MDYHLIILKNAEERILYLDANTIVDDDLYKFYATDFADNLAMAMPDMVLNLLEHCYAKYPDLKPYFNAGVLLINNRA